MTWNDVSEAIWLLNNCMHQTTATVFCRRHFLVVPFDVSVQSLFSRRCEWLAHRIFTVVPFVHIVDEAGGMWITIPSKSNKHRVCGHGNVLLCNCTISHVAIEKCWCARASSWVVSQHFPDAASNDSQPCVNGVCAVERSQEWAVASGIARNPLF